MTDDARFKVLVADGDVTARVRLSVFLRTEPGVEVVGECEHGLQAVQALHDAAPDIAFLAVDLPEVGGVEVLACARGDAPPTAVFLVDGERGSADVLAAEGFCCLAKPYDRGRLHEAIETAVRRREEDVAELDRRLAAVLERLRPRSATRADRLVVRHQGTVAIVPTAEIDWIGAARNYVKVHAGGEVHTLRATMADMERRLDAHRFLRIHRSIIVNTDRLRGVQPWFHGDAVVVLDDGTRLNISRGYRPRVQRFLDRLAAAGG